VTEQKASPKASAAKTIKQTTSPLATRIHKEGPTPGAASGSPKKDGPTPATVKDAAAEKAAPKVTKKQPEGAPKGTNKESPKMKDAGIKKPVPKTRDAEQTPPKAAGSPKKKPNEQSSKGSERSKKSGKPPVAPPQRKTKPEQTAPTRQAAKKSDDESTASGGSFLAFSPGRKGRKKNARLPETPPKPKTNVAERLTLAVDAVDPLRHRSADLIPLFHEYNAMTNHLTALIAALRRYQGAMAFVDRSRMDVFQQVAILADRTPPLYKRRDGREEEFQDPAMDEYASIHRSALAESNESMVRYQDSVIDYVVEWQEVIDNRIKAERLETEALAKTLRHYETKVEALREKINEKYGGCSPPPKQKSKLDRNENKLHQAWREHERCASKLCELIEEATERGWKDLKPLTETMFDFEAGRGSQTRLILAEIKEKVLTFPGESASYEGPVDTHEAPVDTHEVPVDSGLDEKAQVKFSETVKIANISSPARGPDQPFEDSSSEDEDEGYDTFEPYEDDKEDAKERLGLLGGVQRGSPPRFNKLFDADDGSFPV
jgi:hypothetical protein